MAPMSSYKSLKALASVMLLSVLPLGCGEGESEDVFYAYVVHGYAGGGELSVYSDAGPVATGLQFGEIAGDPNLPGQPLMIDRTRFGGGLQVFLTGATEVAPVDVDAYSFYPGETVTFFLMRRDSTNSYVMRTMRHNLIANQPVQSAIANQSGYACVAEFNNGLSLSNTYTDGAYDLMLQFNFPSPPNDAYGLPVYETPNRTTFFSECGELSLDSIQGSAAFSTISGVLETRATQMMMLSGAGWYYPVVGTNSDFLEYRVGRWVSPQGGGANIQGLRSYDEFRTCVASAVKVPVLMDSGGLGVSCDTDKLDEIEVDAVSLQECLRTTNYTGLQVSPSGSSQILYYNPIAGQAQCSMTIRPRTRNVDTIFNPGSDGDVADDSIPTFNISYRQNSWQHVTFFGTPINPLIYSFNAKDRSQPLATIQNPDNTVAEIESGVTTP